MDITITNINEQAAEKLSDELKGNDNPYAEPVINYLIDRCIEDSGMAEDVMQEHKTWEKCFKYILDQARQIKSSGSCVMVKDETVYEWAEDYYHKDDKALEAKKAKKETEEKREKKKAAPKVKPELTKGQQALKQIEKVNKDIKGDTPAKSDQLEGQMDIFSWLGGMGNE